MGGDDQSSVPSTSGNESTLQRLPVATPEKPDSSTCTSENSTPLGAAAQQPPAYNDAVIAAPTNAAPGNVGAAQGAPRTALPWNMILMALAVGGAMFLLYAHISSLHAEIAALRREMTTLTFTSPNEEVQGFVTNTLAPVIRDMHAHKQGTEAALAAAGASYRSDLQAVKTETANALQRAISTVSENIHAKIAATERQVSESKEYTHQYVRQHGRMKAYEETFCLDSTPQYHNGGSELYIPGTIPEQPTIYSRAIGGGFNPAIHEVVSILVRPTDSLHSVSERLDVDAGGAHEGKYRIFARTSPGAPRVRYRVMVTVLFQEKV